MTESQLDILASKIAQRLSEQPRWVGLKAAARYSGIGQKDLVRLAQDREIDGFQDLRLKTKPWIFDKESIDIFRKKQVEEFNDPSENEKIAFDILESMDI